jgi:hypothetical protein
MDNTEWFTEECIEDIICHFTEIATYSDKDAMECLAVFREVWNKEAMKQAIKLCSDDVKNKIKILVAELDKQKI